MQILEEKTKRMCVRHLQTKRDQHVTRHVLQLRRRHIERLILRAERNPKKAGEERTGGRNGEGVRPNERFDLAELLRRRERRLTRNRSEFQRSLQKIDE